MEYSRIAVSQADALWELQKAYKAEIEEDHNHSSSCWSWSYSKPNGHA